MMHSRLGYLIAAAVLLAAMPAAASARNAVLLELFTSEGCSSCPPADDLLAELDRAARAGNAEVIVLGEHVDYWNRLGWMDPFSSAGFSDRQKRYASRFGNRGVYTPQVVVDGRAELVGSDRFRLLRAVGEAATQPKASVSVRSEARPGGGVTVPLVVEVEGLPPHRDREAASVLLAVTEGPLRTQVRRGENAGRTLTHAAVARRLTELGTLSAAAPSFRLRIEVRLDPGWAPANLKAVVFVQERGAGRVLGAASARLFP